MDQQATRNSRKALSMLELYTSLKASFIRVTRSQYAVPLLDFIFSTPIFQPSQVRWNIQPPSQPRLTTMLTSLHREGILAMLREGAGRRSYIWGLTPLIDLAEQRFDNF